MNSPAFVFTQNSRLGNGLKRWRSRKCLLDLGRRYHHRAIQAQKCMFPKTSKKRDIGFEFEIGSVGRDNHFWHVDNKVEEERDEKVEKDVGSA